MKSVTFKKTYIATSDFSPLEMTWFITAALENVHASFKDKSQYDDIVREVGENLVLTFEEQNYKLEYHGPDLNSHYFKITNGVKIIDIVMSANLFNTNFQIA